MPSPCRCVLIGHTKRSYTWPGLFCGCVGRTVRYGVYGAPVVRSKGYIDVVLSHNSKSSSLADDLLQAWRGVLGMGIDAPQHLYSHRGTMFLNELLNNADEVAKH